MSQVRTHFFAFPVLLAASLAGCSGGAPTGQDAAQATPGPQASGTIPPAPANDPDAQTSALLAAAEPFEKLTESAFITDTARLDGLIAEARTSAAGASKRLSPGEARALSGDMDKIAAARSSGNRADLAIAAVEGYRTLVSNAGGNRKIPPQVSLLDYSGFRFQADLKADPIRWTDAVRALDFADRQWQGISAQVDDKALRGAVTKALAAMRSASRSKDPKAAMTASTRELDLVDRLESYFART